MKEEDHRFKVFGSSVPLFDGFYRLNLSVELLGSGIG